MVGTETFPGGDSKPQKKMKISKVFPTYMCKDQAAAKGI